jgi:hypothetical protein
MKIRATVSMRSSGSFSAALARAAALASCFCAAGSIPSTMSALAFVARARAVAMSIRG